MKEKHTRIGNMAITAAILAATSAFSYLLHRVSNSDFHVPMLFVLAVLFISLLTDGYVYGIIASMAAVIGVNYIFTYPYFAFSGHIFHKIRKHFAQKTYHFYEKDSIIYL